MAVIGSRLAQETMSDGQVSCTSFLTVCHQGHVVTIATT